MRKTTSFDTNYGFTFSKTVSIAEIRVLRRLIIGWETTERLRSCLWIQDMKHKQTFPKLLPLYASEIE